MIEKNISVLFNSLDTTKKTNVIDGGYTISELTLAQQKDLITSVFDPYESMARTNISFNNIIRHSVKSETPITVRERPYLLRALRDLISSPKFTRNVEEETINFELIKNNFKKVEKIPTTETIQINNNIIVNIKVPTLEYDDQINNDIINTIGTYKRSLNNKNPDAGYITSLYYIFEIIRYVESIIVGSDEYKFEDMISSERKRCIEMLPKVTADKIVAFIEKIKETEKIAFTAKNLVTKETEQIVIAPNIFSEDL